jgi:hypothetical protein
MSISGDIEVHHDEDVYTFCDGGISPITEFRKGKQQYPPFWMVAGCCSEGRGVLFFHRNVFVPLLQKEQNLPENNLSTYQLPYYMMFFR